MGWYVDPSSDNHDPLVLQGVNGVWNLVSSPTFKAGGDSGLAAITAIPGGGLWAVGVTFHLHIELLNRHRVAPVIASSLENDCLEGPGAYHPGLPFDTTFRPRGQVQNFKTEALPVSGSV